jgi:predicted transcriptional regulator
VTRDKTLGRMLEDLLCRAFGGSATALVAHLLDQSSPSPGELDEIRRTIDRFRQGGD